MDIFLLEGRPTKRQRKMKRLTSFLLGFLLFSLAFPSPVAAKSLHDDQVVLGGTYVLDEDETLTGNLVVIGGIAELEKGSVVNGDIILVGGSLTANGSVNGNVVLIGSSAKLESSVKIFGDLLSFSSSLDQEKGSIISGRIKQNYNIPFESHSSGATPSIPDIKPEIKTPYISPLMSASKTGFRSFVLAILAMLAAMIFPNAIQRASRPVMVVPVLAGGTGLLTAFIAPIMLAIIAITIIGIPITIIGALLLAYAAFLGWIAVGQEIGSRLAGAFKSQWHIAVKAGVGTLLLTLVTDAIARISCVGWVIPFLISIIGLGAVVLTRLGTREYLNGQS